MVRSQQTYDICATSAQRRRRWADVVQMLTNVFFVCKYILFR